MSEPIHTIWDGKVIRQVPKSEAEMLEKKDMAQNMTARFIAGHEFKTRAQFTGYKTREMRAEQPPVQTTDAPTGHPITHGEESLGWRSYKTQAAEYFGIEKASKVTKAQVLEYMEANGLSTA